ncbi:MAG: hypothetical protein HY708_01310, partial [Ignavibacteriae bacterium]|nr:hypothetical protein [Ignavibacteriota bacterium]
MTYMLISITTLLLMVDSYDSGIAKGPILVTISSLVAATFLADLFRRGNLECAFSNVDVAVFGLVLLSLISATLSAYPLFSWPACSIWVAYMIMFLVGSRLFIEKSHVLTLIIVMAIVSAIVSVVGLVQFFFEDQLMLEFYLDERKRIGSTLGNAAFLGAYIVLILPVLLSQVIIKSKYRLFYLVVAVSLVFVLFLTQSRSGLIAFACSVPLLFLLLGNSRRKITFWILGTTFIGLLGTMVTAPLLIDRMLEMFALDPTSSFAR